MMIEVELEYEDVEVLHYTSRDVPDLPRGHKDALSALKSFARERDLVPFEGPQFYIHPPSPEKGSGPLYEWTLRCAKREAWEREVMG